MEILVVSFVRVAGYNIRCLSPSDIHFVFIFFIYLFLCVQLCLVMLADWLAQQVMGLLTQLLMAIGCTKEECLDLNIGRVSASRMEAGRLFQRRGARYLKALPSTVVFDILWITMRAAL